MEPHVVVLPIGDDSPEARLYYGQDVRETLRALPENSIHMVATSPPYWGLRDYGTGDAQIGLEQSPDEYIEQLVEVFREIARVLRPDGTVWLNLGDSYIGGGRAGSNPEYHAKHTMFGKTVDEAEHGKFGLPQPIPEGMKAKDMAGIPWRVAFALQADGWYLRAAAPWIKRNVMPEPVTDRPANGTEFIFLLAHPESKGSYFYDIDAVRKETRNRRNTDWFFESASEVAAGEQTVVVADDGTPLAFASNPKSYKGAHFAVWPPSLVAPMVLAGTSAEGCCAECGTPWKRRRGRPCKECGAFIPTQGNACPECGHRNDWKAERGISEEFGTVDWSSSGRATPRKLGASGKQGGVPAQGVIYDGWEPGCDCGSDEKTRPVVLDPFSGSATTGLVALQQGRDYIGCDLNADYLDMAEARIRHRPPPKTRKVEDEGVSIFGLFGSSESEDS